MKRTIVITAAIAATLALTACSDQKKNSENDAPTSGAMKCGAGKCGANMVKGNSDLATRQRSLMIQMSPDDPRMGCVMNAKTTEALYACVKDPKTGKLTMDYNATE